jgi:hypothetical protein
MRIARPSVSEMQSTAPVDGAQQASQDGGTSSAQLGVPDTPVHTAEDSQSNSALKANARFDSESQPSSPYRSPIVEWQAQNMPWLQERNGATMGSAPHKGFMGHVGGALFKVGGVVGTVASSYVPVATVHGHLPPEPKITIDVGHCPAAFDPAFQVPVRWWDQLQYEQGCEVLGAQWKFWLVAVQSVFESHARELRETPGVASLHVIVNPDGSIFSLTPYTGAERAHQELPVNERTLAHLRQIVLSVGKFPPFPDGTRVRCYHLIFGGSAGI